MSRILIFMWPELKLSNHLPSVHRLRMCGDKTSFFYKHLFYSTEMDTQTNLPLWKLMYRLQLTFYSFYKLLMRLWS